MICIAGNELSTLTLGNRGMFSPGAAAGLVYGGASSYSGGWPIGGEGSLFVSCGLTLGVRTAGSLPVLSPAEDVWGVTSLAMSESVVRTDSADAPRLCWKRWVLNREPRREEGGVR